MSRYRTDDDLEDRAKAFRQKLGLSTQAHIDLMTVIQKLKGTYPGFDYKRVRDEELPEAEAQWDAGRQTILLRESVFRGMQRNEARARMTVAHEISHFLLNHDGIRNRSLVKTAAEQFVREVKREESEANRLAPRLLAPSYLIASGETPEQISRRFGMSLEASAIRREEVNALERRAKGLKRELPPVVIDFLREAKRRGQQVTTDLGD